MRATIQFSQVNPVVRQVATSPKERFQTVWQINTVTQQVAANAEESAASATELTSQSTSLEEMVSEFRLTDSHTPVKRAA